MFSRKTKYLVSALRDFRDEKFPGDPKLKAVKEDPKLPSKLPDLRHVDFYLWGVLKN